MRDRRGEASNRVSHERWLLTYADLITLLMAFFIVLFAMSRTDAARFSELAREFRRAFRVPVLQGYDPTALAGRDGPPVLGPVPAADPRTVLADAIRADLEAYAAAHGVQGRLGAATHQEGVLVTLSGELLFAPGEAELLPGARELVWTAAARLVGLPHEIRVAGHTDSVPIRTPYFPSNWELSTARALAVVHALEDLGIAAERLVAIGHGAGRPVADNDTPEGRARNRRVELLVVLGQPAGGQTP